MVFYSLALMLGLVATAPWWLWRMATSGRYREGLAGRLGRVPTGLREAVAGKRTVWVHAVSVGEVLAVERLIGELRDALPGVVIAVSTTTATGQKIARERLVGSPVFYFPLDFRFAVRAYLKVLRPELMVLVESEFWPRHLVECRRAGVPVAVVNARVSDRSFPRYMRLRWVWRRLFGLVDLFLAQGDETAERLMAIGAMAERVRRVGNLKFDVRVPKASGMAERIRGLAAGRPIVVAGSTVEADGTDEEMLLIQAWEGEPRRDFGAMLVLAPRHPQRFGLVESIAVEFPYVKASDGWGLERGSSGCGETVREVESGSASSGSFGSGSRDEAARTSAQDDSSWGGLGRRRTDVVLLDTLGDLAAVYEIADVAFVGGSLVAKGGHNPLEPARFGVPVVMGPSFENFREIVVGMRAADGIRIVEDGDGLRQTLVELLGDRAKAQALGDRGRQVFEQQSGATVRTVAALIELIRERAA